tara:strand:+ start:375 stop:1709 length:1335 start_codon:yes stop_codon:yes gene_type:complete
MSSGSTSYLQIFPSNITSNTRVSYKNGQPVISFSVGSQDRLLIPNSVRLCGNIAYYKSGSGATGVVPLETDAISINPKLSSSAFVDQLVLSSQKHKSTIEHVRHWGRMMSSMLPNISSKQEAIGSLGVSTNCLPNFKTNQLTTVNNENGSSAVSRVFEGNNFCFPLTSGFLSSSEPISLSEKGSGISGLNIDIHLLPDAQMFNNAAAFQDAFYQLTDLSIICEVVNPSMDQLSQMMSATSGVREYNAITSYYQTVSAVNSIINFRLGLSNVLSVFMNFIPSEYLNNLTYDGFATLPLINNLGSGEIAPVNQVIFLRGGEKLPLQYDINTNVRDQVGSVVADPGLVREFMNSFTPFMKNHHSQLNPNTNNRVGFTDVEEFAEGGLTFGIGVAMDSISGTGINFLSENFGVQLETGLTSGLSHSAFLFVRSRQTLAFNAQGLQVIV